MSDQMRGETQRELGVLDTALAAIAPERVGIRRFRACRAPQARRSSPSRRVCTRTASRGAAHRHAGFRRRAASSFRRRASAAPRSWPGTASARHRDRRKPDARARAGWSAARSESRRPASHGRRRMRRGRCLPPTARRCRRGPARDRGRRRHRRYCRCCRASGASAWKSFATPAAPGGRRRRQNPSARSPRDARPASRRDARMRGQPDPLPPAPRSARPCRRCGHDP